MRTYPGQFSDVAFSKVNWNESHQEFGWVFNTRNPVQHIDLENGINVTYVANKEGFRDSKWSYLEGLNPHQQNILVFGDSQTFGYGVEEDVRFSNQIEKMINSEYKIYNIAIPGWGLDQMYLAFKKFVPIFKPRIVIFAYINSDLLRSLESYREGEGLNKPSFEIEKGSLQIRKRNSRNIVEKFFKEIISGKVYSINYFYKNLYRHYCSITLNEKFIQEIIKLAEYDKIKLIFVRIPGRDEVSINHQWKMKRNRIMRGFYYNIFGLYPLLQQNRQIYIDPMEIMKERYENEKINFYFHTDYHINENAHRLIAELIVKHIQRNDRIDSFHSKGVEGKIK